MLSEIPFIRPTFPASADLALDLDEILKANWFTNFGPKERQFARALGDYVGSEVHVATCANGTVALIAALTAAVGAGTRDRYLLMPSFTFIAVAQAALWAGYRPWFIDVDADTWQPSIESAETILTGSRDDVAGVLLPNVFGVGNPQIDAWEALCAKWDLPIVIDSAAGFGSRYSDGNPLGSRGTCEIFSFHATKPFAIGEGGAVTSRDPALIARVRDFENFGFTDSRECTQLGMNGKLQEISAAIGLRQLVGLDQRLAQRHKVFDRYQAELASEGLRFQVDAEASSLCFASARCSSADHKASVLTSLRDNAVQARDYYNPPQHRHPYFVANPELTRSTSLPVTEELCSQIVSLPVHDDMSPEDVDRIVNAVRQGRIR